MRQQAQVHVTSDTPIRAQDALLDNWCAQSPIIPVISIESLEYAVALGQALVAGGLNVLEITLRTEFGLPAIEALRNALPDAIIGAGTVLDQAQFRAAVSAGSQFVVTPGASRRLLTEMIASDVPVLPGVATISEVLEGYEQGLRRFKFFPAEVAGGVPALKAFAGPLQGVKFCPTGGIKPENIKQYLALDNVIAAGGTWLTPAAMIQSQDWSGITRLAKDSLALLRP